MRVVRDGFWPSVLMLGGLLAAVMVAGLRDAGATPAREISGPDYSCVKVPDLLASIKPSSAVPILDLSDQEEVRLMGDLMSKLRLPPLERTPDRYIFALRPEGPQIYFARNGTVCEDARPTPEVAVPVLDLAIDLIRRRIGRLPAPI